MQVRFEADLKSVNTKQLVSGDNSTRLVIEKDSLPADKLALLNSMFSSLSNKSQELIITIDSGLEA